MANPFDFVANINPTTVVMMTKKLSLAFVKRSKSFLVKTRLFSSSLDLYEPVLDTVNTLNVTLH